jgi:hypothetical protein
MIRTPRLAPSLRGGFASSRALAVLLAVGGGSLVLLAFVLPHLASEAGHERQVRAAPVTPGDAGATPPATTPSEVVLVEAIAPPDVDPQVVVVEPAPQDLAASALPAAALEKAAPAVEPLRFVPGGRAERVTPEQARERQKKQAAERRKAREEQGLPPIEKPRREGTERPIQPENVKRLNPKATKAKGYGKGRRRGG